MIFLWSPGVLAPEALQAIVWMIWWSVLLWMLGIAIGPKWWDVTKAGTLTFFVAGPQVGLLVLILWLTSRAMFSLVSDQSDRAG